MATRYVPGASSIEIPLRDTDEVSVDAKSFQGSSILDLSIFRFYLIVSGSSVHVHVVAASLGTRVRKNVFAVYRHMISEDRTAAGNTRNICV